MSAAASPPRAFPWDQVMAAGFGMLRLSPEAFWSMTPREFERAASVLPMMLDMPAMREDLNALMRAYPELEEVKPRHG